MHAIIPVPQANVSVRDATLADVPFIDALQKRHSDKVGFMRTSWIEAKINAGQVIVAEESVGSRQYAVGSEEGEVGDVSSAHSLPTAYCLPPTPLGYCMGVDRYFKRDDVGIIYQLNVVPGHQRSFIGMTLLKAMFDRSAYGCRLFCCWCAQDLEANRFWEAMGFVPLAFRAGSEKKARVHIFWQKRIRAGDVGERATPWWFPAKTDGGAMREDRIVFPIPQGLHWSDAMPIILPAEDRGLGSLPEQKKITDKASGKASGKARRAMAAGPMDAPPRDGPVRHGPRQFGAPSAVSPVAPSVPETLKAQEKPKPQKKPKQKADPALVAAARELRDRWLERVNSGEQRMVGTSGKYDIVRRLAAPTAHGEGMDQARAIAHVAPVALLGHAA